MRGTALAPEVLRARKLVRVVVVCDLVYAVLGLGAILYVMEFTLLWYALLITVPLLVCDTGAWSMDLPDLRRRAVVGAAVLIVGLVVFEQQKRGHGLVFYETTSGISVPLLGFALQCGLSFPVFLHAHRVALRHRVEHYHPAHVGSGGGTAKKAIDMASKPNTSGFPSGWVGRRRFF